MGVVLCLPLGLIGGLLATVCTWVLSEMGISEDSASLTMNPKSRSGKFTGMGVW